MSALASQINWETDLFYSNHHIYCMVLDPQEHMRSDCVKEHVSTFHKKPSSLRISVCYLRLKVCPYYSLFTIWIESSSYDNPVQSRPHCALCVTYFFT